MTRRSIGRLLPLAALMVFLPLNGLAQNPPPPPPPAMGVPGLTLSPAQQARFNARNAKFAQEVTALRADPKLTPAQKQAKFVTLYQAVDRDMMLILTPAQRALVAKQRSQSQARMAAFQKAHGAQIKEGQSLAAQLNRTLTKEQQKRLGALNAAEQAQIQQIGQDRTLPTAAKQQKAQAVDAAAQTQILAVLTPAQRTMFTRMMQIKKSLAATSMAPGHH